jgi:hypothetical protein
MKKQNQVPNKKGRTTKKTAQQKRPAKTQVKPCRVHTGHLVWDIGEFQQAEANGRFVTVGMTEMQALQLKRFPDFGLKEFLAVATHSQLAALREATPLCQTMFFKEPSCDAARPPQILALIGPGPAGKIDASMKRSRAVLAAELKRRGL